MHDILSGFAAHLLFLKATTKKQVWIPQFTKKNGQVVGGHFAQVHVADDHSNEKVASGAGSYSQKKAHAKLAKEGDAFHALPVDDKAALVMHHATQIQDEESMTARLATLKKKLLGGEKPLGSEWKAYHAAPADKQAKILDAVKEAGALASFDAQYATWAGANPDAAKEAPPAAEGASTAATSPPPAAEQSKDEPKPAPVRAKPAAPVSPGVEAAQAAAALPPGAPAKPSIMGSLKAKAVTDQIEAAMLAGDHDALDAALAEVPMTSDKIKWQKIKAYAGEASKFIGGQKQAATLAPAAAPIDAGPQEGDTKPGKNGGTLVLKDGHWQMQAASSSAWAFIKDAESGAAVVKEAAKEWQAANPGKDTELSSALVDAGYLEYAKGMGIYQPPGAAAAPAAEKPKAPRIKSATVNSDEQAKLKLKAAISGAKVPSENTNAKSFNPKVDAILAALDAGDEKALLAMSYGTNTYGKKAAKLANDALAFLGSTHAVTPGQKGGEHDGLKVKVASIKVAEPAQEPAEPVTAPATAGGGKLTLPGKMGDSFELVNMAYTFKDAGAFNWDPSGVQDWVDEESISAFDELPPVDQAAYVQAVMAWHPSASEGMAKWLAWKDAQPQKGVAVAADGMPEMPTNLLGGDKSLIAEALAKHATGDLADLEKFAYYAESSGMFQSQAVDFVQKLHAHLEHKKTGEPSPKNGVGPNPKALTEAEIPAMPEAKNSVKILMINAKKAALVGDLKAVKYMKDSIPGPTVLPLSHAYFDALIHKLEAKSAAKPTADAPASAAESGPKEGETKQGADGMLIFQDGRWHKMGTDGKAVEKQAPTDPKALKQKAASVPMPKLSGTYAIKMKKSMMAIKALAESQGAAGVAKCVAISSVGTVKISSGNGNSYGWFAIDPDGNSNSENGKAMAKYAKALLAAMEGTIGYEPVPVAAAAQAAKPTPAVSVAGLKTEKVGELHALLADGWKQVGPQGGSNPGGLFEDSKGGKWYCKFPSDPETVKNELLAAKFYQMLGVTVPNLRLVKKDGKLGIASGWVDGVKKGGAEDLAKAPGAHKGFVFDAWLANWDVVGASNDNLMLNPDGKAVRIDVGGSLIFRAQGGKKGEAFGNEVPELSTLRDAAKNEKSAAVFAGVSEDDIKAGVRQLNKLKPSQIEELVQKAGPGTAEEKKALAATLIARREFILKRYKVRDQWEKKPVDEAKVKINAGDIPQPTDFFNHPDKGGGPLSSKDWLNKQNTADSAALAEFAQQGNLKALKDYHYQAVDGSGNEAGMKPITQHPSKHIQMQWAALVQTLQSAAYPPAETLEMPSFGFGGTLEEMAHEVGAFAPHLNVTTVPAEHRLGYFMSLAKLDGDAVAEHAKESKSFFQKVGGAFASAGKEHYAKLSKTVKGYISGVQSSGSINHVWSQGKTEANGMPIGQFTKAIYDDAMEMPEGTTLLRWMDDDTAGDIMTKQLKECGPGTVLQNTNSMCTSYNEGWGSATHFCGEPKKAILMRIVAAKGAKATPSHGSGSFSSENEITTLPGQRFVIVSVTKGSAIHPDGIVVDCIMLPPDEGFVAQLAAPSPLTKSEQWSETECLTSKSNNARLKVIVLRRTPSPSRAIATSAALTL